MREETELTLGFLAWEKGQEVDPFTDLRGSESLDQPWGDGWNTGALGLRRGVGLKIPRW